MRVKLSDVRVVASPREAPDWEAPAAERRAQAAKQAAVAAAELDKLRLAAGSGTGSLADWLVGPLVEALHLELAGVHVRFQELLVTSERGALAAPGGPADAAEQGMLGGRRPAALGVCLDKLVLRAATPEDGDAAADAAQHVHLPPGGAEAGMTHKVVIVTGLSAYVDPGVAAAAEQTAGGDAVSAARGSSHHILEPLDAALHVRLSKRGGGVAAAQEGGGLTDVDLASAVPQSPPATGNALFIHAAQCAAPAVRVTDAQMGVLLRVADACDVWSTRNKYGVYRPPSWRATGRDWCSTTFGAMPRHAGGAAADVDVGSNVRPHGWASDGWRYACGAVLATLRAGRRWTSRQELLARRDTRLAYLAASAARLHGDGAISSSSGVLLGESEPAAVIEAVEAGLSVSDILLFRTMAEQHVASLGVSATAAVGGSRGQAAGASAPLLAAESSTGSLHSSSGGADGDADAGEEEDIQAGPVAPPPQVAPSQPGGTAATRGGGRRQQRRGWVRSGVAFVLGSLPLVDARRRFPSLLAPEEKEWRDELLRALEATAESGADVSSPGGSSSTAIHAHFSLAGLTFQLAYGAALASSIQASLGGVALRADVGAATAVQLRLASLHVTLDGGVDGGAPGDSPALSTSACTLCAAHGTLDTPMLLLDVDMASSPAEPSVRGALQGLTLAHAPQHGPALAACGEAVVRYLPREGASLLEHRVAAACGLATPQARDAAREQIVASMGGPWCVQAFTVEDTTLLMGSAAALDAALGAVPGAPAALSASREIEVSAPLSPVREADDTDSLDSPGTPPARNESCELDQAGDSGIASPATPHRPLDAPAAAPAVSPCCLVVHISSASVATPPVVEADQRSGAARCPDTSPQSQAGYTRLNIVVSDITASVQCPAQQHAAAVAVRLAEWPSVHASLALLRLPRDSECIAVRAAVKTGVLAAQVSPASARLVRSVLQSFDSGAAAHSSHLPEQPGALLLYADVSLTVAAVSLDLLPPTRDGYWQTWCLDGLALSAANTAANGAVVAASVARCRADGAPAGGRAPSAQLARFLPSIAGDATTTALQFDLPHSASSPLRTPSLLTARYTAPPLAQQSDAKAAVASAVCHVDGLDAAISWGALTSVTAIADACSVPWQDACHGAGQHAQCHALAMEAQAAAERHRASRGAHLSSAGGPADDGAVMPAHRSVSDGAASSVARRAHQQHRSAAHDAPAPGDTSSSGMSETLSEEGRDEEDGNDVWEDAVSAWGTESEMSDADRHGGMLGHAGSLSGRARVGQAHAAAAAAHHAAAKHDTDAHERHAQWLRLGFAAAAAAANTAFYAPDDVVGDADPGPLRVRASASSLRLRLLVDDLVTGSATLASARVTALRLTGDVDASHGRQLRFDVALDILGVSLADESGWRPVPVLGGNTAAAPLTVTARARSGEGQQVHVTAAVRSARAVLAVSTVQSLFDWAHHGAALFDSHTPRGSATAAKPVQVQLEWELHDALVVFPEASAPSGVDPRCALLALPHVAVTSSHAKHGLLLRGITLTAAPSERAPGHEAVLALPELTVDATPAGTGATTVTVALPRSVAVCLSPSRVGLLALLAHQLLERFAGHGDAGDDLSLTPSRDAPRSASGMAFHVSAVGVEVRLRGDQAQGGGALAARGDTPHGRLTLRALAAHLDTAAPGPGAGGRGHVTWEELSVTDDATQPGPTAGAQRGSVPAPLFHLASSAGSLAAQVGTPRVDVDWSASAAVCIRVSVSNASVAADVTSWERLVGAASACLHAASLAPTGPVPGGANHGLATPAATSGAEVGSAANSAGGLTPQRSVQSTSAAVLRQQFTSSAAALEVLMSPHSGSSAAVAAAAAALGHGAVVSPMHDALETVRHAVPALHAIATHGRADHETSLVGGDAAQPHSAKRHVASAFASAAAAPAAGQQALQRQPSRRQHAASRHGAAAPLVVNLSVDAQAWQLMVPQGAHLRFGMFIDASATVAATGGDTRWAIEVRCAPVVLSLLDVPPPQAQQLQASAQSGPHTAAVAAAPHALRRINASTASLSADGHWALPPSGSERSLSFASVASSTLDLAASPRSADQGTWMATGGQAASSRWPLLQLDGLCFGAVSTPPSAPASGIHITAKATAVSAWVSPRRLHALRALQSAAAAAAVPPHGSTQPRIDGSAGSLVLAVPLRVTCEAASIAALLSDDRAGVTVPILEAALLDAAIDVSIRPLAAPFEPLDAAAQTASVAASASGAAAPAPSWHVLDVTSRATALVDYYNTDIAAWEPFFEPWRVTLRGGLAPGAASPAGPPLPRGHVAVTSPGRVDITLTTAGSDALAAAKDALTAATGDGQPAGASQGVPGPGTAATATGFASPFWLHNHSGVPLRYVLVAADASQCGIPSASPQLEAAFQAGQSNGAAGVVAPGGLAPLLVAGTSTGMGAGGRYVRTHASAGDHLSSGDNGDTGSSTAGGAASPSTLASHHSAPPPPAYKCVRFALEGSPWFSRGVALTALGARHFDARVGTTRARAVCDVARRAGGRGGRILHVRSDVSLRNSCATALDIAIQPRGAADMHGASSDSGTITPLVTLAPGERTWLPLLSTDGGLPSLRCRPVAPDADATGSVHYAWSDSAPMRHLLDVARSSVAPLGPGAKPGAVLVCPVSNASARGGPFWVCVDCSPLVWAAAATRSSGPGAAHAAGEAAAPHVPVGIELRLRPPLDVFNALPVPVELCIRGPGAGGSAGGEGDTLMGPLSRFCVHSLDPASVARLFFRPDGFARSNPVALPTAQELMQQAVAHGYSEQEEQGAEMGGRGEWDDLSAGDDVARGPPAALGAALSPRLFEVVPTSTGAPPGGGVTLGVSAWPVGGAARGAVLRARLVVYNHTRLLLAAEPVATSPAAVPSVGPGDTPTFTMPSSAALQPHSGAHLYDAQVGWRRGRGRVLPPATQGELQASAMAMGSAAGGGLPHPPIAGLRVLTSAGRHALESSSKLGLAVASAAGPPVWSSPANSMADLLALPAGAVTDATPEAAAPLQPQGAPPSPASRAESHVTATPVLLGSEADWLPGAPPLRLRLQAASSAGMGGAGGASAGAHHAQAASTGMGAWSKTFGADPVDAATSSRTQTVLTPSAAGAYALVVTRAPSSAVGPSPGEWPATSVVHIRPRCSLRNGLSCALRVRVVPASGAAPATQFGGSMHARALVLAPGAWCEVHPWEDPEAGHAATSSSLFWSATHPGSGSGGAGAFPGALVSLRYAEGGWDWSGALPLDTPGETLLRLRHRGRGASHVLRIDVRESRAAPGTWTAAVVASSAASSAGTAAGASFMPFRLENFTGVTLRFRQRVGPRGSGVFTSSAAWAGGLFAPGRRNRSGPVSSASSLPDTDAVPPYNAAEFAWDEPTQPRRLVLEAPPDKGGLLGTFGLDTVGTVATLRAGGAELLIRVSADGPTRVLSVIDTALHPAQHMGENTAVEEVDEEATRQNHHSHHSHHHASAHALLPVVPFAGELLSIGVDIGGLALSLVGPTEELLYACISGVTLHAARSALDVTLHARAVRVQVDNQLRRTSSPVMLSCGGQPVGPISSAAAAVLRRAESVRSGGAALGEGNPQAAASAHPTGTAPHNTIDIAVLAPSSAEALLPRRPGPAVALRFARWRRRANGVVCVREMVVEVSPMTVDLDDQLVEALPAFVRALVEPHGSSSSMQRSGPSQVDGHECEADVTSADDVDASRSQETKVYIERLHISPLRIRLTARRLPFLPHGVKVLTCIEGAALTFAGLDLAHPLLPARELAAHAVRHYQRQGRAAVTTLVGSVSLLGDPVGLAAALRRAAWRLVHGAEPEDDDAGGMSTPASAAGLRHDPLSATRLASGGAASSSASSARRFASDLVVALTDALRKSSGAIRVVALRASVELEARVQRRAAQQQQLQLASASRDGMARQHSLARQTTLSRSGSASRPGSPTNASASGSAAVSPGGLATPPQTPQQGASSRGSLGGGGGSHNAGGRAGGAQQAPSSALLPGALHQPELDAVDAAADADVLSALAHGLAALLAAPFVGLERRGIVGALEGAALGIGAALARPAASAAALAVRVATATRDAAAHGVAAQPPPVSRVRPPRVVPPAPHPVPRYSAEHAAGAAILRAASGLSHRRHDSGRLLPTPLGRLPVLPFRGAWTLVGYTSCALGTPAPAAHGGHCAQAAYLVLTPRHALVGSPPTSPGAHEWVVPWATPLPCVITCTTVSPGVLRLLLVSPLHMRLDADAGAAHRWRRAMAALEGKEHRGDAAWGLPTAVSSSGGGSSGEEDGENGRSHADGTGDTVLLAPRHTYRVVPPACPWTSLTLYFGDEDAAAAAGAAIEAASAKALGDGVVTAGGGLAQRVRLDTLHEA